MKSKDFELEKIQMEIRLLKRIEPAVAERMLEIVKKLDDRLVLIWSLLFLYGGNGDVKFLDVIEEAVAR